MLDLTQATTPSRIGQEIRQIFSPSHSVALMMQMEVALAQVQAKRGIIPAEAAAEIHAKAQVECAPLDKIQAAAATMGHPLVAVLKTWGAQLSPVAAPWLHYGATTQDIFNTVLILQLQQASRLMLRSMQQIEAELIKLARTHRATPMIGRTLGRHAGPISFGMKVTSWLAEQRRGAARLAAWCAQYNTGTLSGAVSTYAALGAEGVAIEAEVMQTLGLNPPEAADWKGARDRFAEFASHLAIAARSYARMAQEIFLLQGDDIGELDEANTGVGSSTMPHKSNPTLCLEAMSRAREVSTQLQAVLEWMGVIFERDSAQQTPSLHLICEKMGDVLGAVELLVQRIKVKPENMLRNLGRTNGLILAEDLTFRLAKSVGKTRAHSVAHELASAAIQQGISLQAALLQAQAHTPELQAQLQLPADYFEFANHLGQAAARTDAALAALQAQPIG